MKPDPLAPETERRKQVRLLRRRDLAISVQKYEGRTYYVVKDPVSLRYYRFKEQEHFLLQLMDGGHTLDQSQKEFEKRFRPDRLTLEDLEQFGQQLLQAGLVQNESPQSGKQLFTQRKKRKRMERLQMFTNIMYIKLPIFDPDRLLTRMLPWLRWMFTTWFLVASCAVMAWAVMLVLTHFDTFYGRLPSYHEFFSFKTVMYLWAALGVVKVIHEFGHGLSCKAFGGEVHEMGFLFLVFSPAMYCNVSDAWTLPNKWHRIIIGGAGIYVELMIAALATFVWWNTPNWPFVNYLSLSLMIVCSVSTVLFNGNPLMRFDGYYVLADWLEIPNLRDRSNRYLQRLVMEHCLGIEVQPEPYMELWRRILFLTYAIVSWVYRWVITFVILYFMATFLRPYKLEIISSLLAIFSVGTMIGWPLFRLIKNVKKRGRLPDMKTPRVLISSSVLAALFLGFLFVPLPVTRVRSPGLVQYQPDDVEPVHVAVPGILKKVHVAEGQYVTRGKVLAEFTSLELETQRNQVLRHWGLKRDLVELYDRHFRETRDPKEKAAIQSTKAEAESERNAAQLHLEVLDREIDRLTIRAPRDGHVSGIPQPDEIGRFWEKDDEKPFCNIGNRTRLRVLVPVTSSDFDLVRANIAKYGVERVPVTIRVQGRGSKTWQGRINKDLPKTKAEEIPVALSSKGGGPVAVRPSSDPSRLQPQDQVFLVAIDFEDPDEAICTGTMAQVKIHNEYRSCAWWCWRAISEAVDLYLL
ncbi:MAG: biotin/lipoyl-binding protein [Gemmataceae bacterium]|nr:biotin/lipoyl-binding protein [Gemmataceae bacterium]